MPAAGTAATGGAGRGAPALSRTARAVAAGASVLSALGTAVVGMALLVARQERLVWQPPRFGRPDPAAPPAGAHRLAYAAADGQPLFAWLVEPPAGRAARTLLTFHGNAELAAWSVPWAHEVARRTGWRVVLPEYRGYAGLGGRVSHAASRQDAAAALAAARALPGADGAPLALYGHSLGSAIAAELASAMAEAGATPVVLLLESPFTSLRAMARMDGRPAFDRAWARIARVDFDTAARVAALELPVAVAHGLVDLVVPARMGLAVHAAARVRGPLLLVSRAGHNTVAELGGAAYWGWLRDALAAALGAAAGAAPAADARAEHLVL